MITLIVAHDENRVIGNKGEIPWNIPEDMKLFKERTEDHVVIMGRKTWYSLPDKPLPNRINIVVTRDVVGFQQKYLKEHGWILDAQDLTKHPLVVRSVEEAVEAAEREDAGVKAGFREAFIIGGEQIYRETLEKRLVRKVIASIVEGEHEGDVFFPKLGNEWQASEEGKHEGFRVVTYRN